MLLYEVPDGYWGAGRAVQLRQIIDYVAPGLGEHAETRFAAQRRDAARATVELAGGDRDASVA